MSRLRRAGRLLADLRTVTAICVLGNPTGRGQLTRISRALSSRRLPGQPSDTPDADQTMTN